MKQLLIFRRLSLRFIIVLNLLIIAEPVLCQRPLPGPGDFEPGVILVKYKQFVTTEELTAEAEKLSIKAAKSSDLRKTLKSFHQVKQTQSISALNIERWKVPANQSLAEIMRKLKQSYLVEYVEPNYLRIPLAPRADGPNDYFYQNSEQWWLESIEADRVFAENRIPVGPEIIIAVLDTGIMLTHEDLASRLVTGNDFFNAGGKGNDDDGHGTHVAGIIGAVTNNTIGIAGLAGTAGIKLMPVKVMDADGGYDSDIARGIVWAVDNGAKVINMSFGSSAMGQVLEDAIDYAYKKNCVVIGAAGNDGALGNPLSYPAAYVKVIAVAACTSTGARASYSEYHDYVDLAAPGGEYGHISGKMISTYYLAVDSYAYAAGTSMSAPVVAGVAALLLIQDNSSTPEEIKQHMIVTADKTGSLINDADGWNRELGWGRVNLYQALTRKITYVSKTAGRATYNYPNPFSPVQREKTYIIIPASASGGSAKLRIFDSIGYPVYEKDVPLTQVYPGSIISWDGRDKNNDWVANGVYPYSLEVGGKIYKNKIAVLNR